MRRGGVVFKAKGGLHFLPALAVQQICALPPITRIPAATELAGIAQADGEIVPVVDLRARDERAGLLLVCSYMGELVGVAFSEVVGVGHWDVDPARSDVLVVGDARVRALDLGALYTKLQASTAFHA